ncbi:MAG: 3'-5' exonuclease [Betaproteobacteria bacterium]|nr:3'-5' exonuclease [Betaproteobacteria bacterium]
MSLFARLLFRATPSLSATEKMRLDAWRRLPESNRSAACASSRFVVADVETTGLNLSSDKLIAIGAVAVENGRIDLGDSFEIILQQQSSSDKDNILIHGIGGTAQTEGMPPVEALLQFLEFLGKDPLIAFHVTFDQTMIKGAIKRYLGFDFKHPWLDLAYVMPGLNPPLAHRFRALDDWTSHFDIQNYARHNALADALSTAQLYLVAQEQAGHKNVETYKGLQALEKIQRWASGIA